MSGNQINRALSGETNRTISDPSVALVAYVTGYDSYAGILGPDRTYYASSGIAPGHDTGAVVTGGTATYDAQYACLVMDDIYDGWFGISGDRCSGYKSINLTADFDAGTLSGATYRRNSLRGLKPLASKWDAYRSEGTNFGFLQEIPGGANLDGPKVAWRLNRP